MKLPRNEIRTDGGTQPRAVIDDDIVLRYVELMTSGVEFPPVDVFHDGESYWLADGFHRYQAVDNLEWEQIDCTVHQGTLVEAQWFSFSANKANGLHRSHEDVRRAVEGALRAQPELSDRDIARHVGVHFNTVASHRAKAEASITNCDRCADESAGAAPEQDEPTRTVTRKGKTYKMKVGKIGKARKSRIGGLSKKHFPAMKLRPDLPANVRQVRADAIRVELPTNHVGNCAYALYHTFAWPYLEKVIQEVHAMAAQDQKGTST